MSDSFHVFDIKIEISEQSVRDLLTTAFESGLYWCDVVDQDLCNDLTIDDFKKGGSEAIKVKEYFPSYQLVPFVDGCSLILKDREDESLYRLNQVSMKRGLVAMARKEIRHFRNFVDENYDAVTGYVWLQCCCFGEVIYG